MKKNLLLPITIIILLIIAYFFANKTNVGGIFRTPTPTATQIITPTSVPAMVLDFDHPILHTISNGNPLKITELRRIYFETEYVVVIVETSDIASRNILLIFNIAEDEEPVLVYEKRGYSIYMKIPQTWLVHENYMQFDTGGFSDRNGNGLPELAVNFNLGDGNCYDCRGLLLVEITANGHVKDITPESDFTPKYFTANDSGKVWLVATHFYEGQFGTQSRAGSPRATQIYLWNENTDSYIDVSKTEVAYYDNGIDIKKKTIESTFEKPLKTSDVMPELAMILFDYEVSGRLEYGWNEIQSLAQLDNWDIKNTSPDELEIYNRIYSILKECVEAGSVINDCSTR